MRGFEQDSILAVDEQIVGIVIDQHEKSFGRLVKEPTLSTIDEEIDTIAFDHYQESLDRISQIEKLMASAAFQNISSELSFSHALATQRASEIRPYLEKRGLIDYDEQEVM